jgi:hypothetical protein
MGSMDESDRIDEVANDLDELTTSVDEMKENPPAGAGKATIDKLADALEQAKDAADALEDEKP